MASIVALTTFLDGRERFKAGESYDVADDRAAYFARNGWADAPGIDPEPAPTSVSLDIHDATHAADDNMGA